MDDILDRTTTAMEACLFPLWWLGYRRRIATDVVRVMSPAGTAAVVAATGGVAVPEIRRGVIEEHDDTSWVSWVLVGEEAPAVVWHLVLISDIW